MPPCITSEGVNSSSCEGLKPPPFDTRADNCGDCSGSTSGAGAAAGAGAGSEGKKFFSFAEMCFCLQEERVELGEGGKDNFQNLHKLR